MSISRCFVPAMLLALFACLFACKGADSGAESTDKAAPSPAPAPAAEKAEPAETSGADAAAGTETETGEDAEPQAPLPESFDKVGVEACDEYVEAYAACIDAKAPEAERDAQRRIVFDNINAWKQMAEGGGSAQKGLQTACRIAREQAKRATAEWGCEW